MTSYVPRARSAVSLNMKTRLETLAHVLLACDRVSSSTSTPTITLFSKYSWASVPTPWTNQSSEPLGQCRRSRAQDGLLAGRRQGSGRIGCCGRAGSRRLWRTMRPEGEHGHCPRRRRRRYRGGSEVVLHVVVRNPNGFAQKMW
eukprot:scaffold109615_cov118-Phaeocystis_antarctica.AAC.2